MTIAQQVKKKIDLQYEGSYINYADLSKHLQENKIDTNKPSIHHKGFDKPYNEYYPLIVYYEDNSMLIVTGHGILAAKETNLNK